MSPNKLNIRYCVLYEFNLKKNATQATNSICLVYGDNVLDVRTCQNWFARFKTGDSAIVSHHGLHATSTSSTS